MSPEIKKYEHVDELDVYFKDVSKYRKRLTQEEEAELSRRIQEGDEEAVSILVKHNLRFVITIAKKYRAFTDVSFADLISEGNIGLIKAAYKFDPKRNAKFSSCAIWWIRSSINECIEKYKSKIDFCLADDLSLGRLKVADTNSMYDVVNEDFERKMNNIQSRQNAIDELVKCLEERERKIIMLFYGLGEYKREMNLDEISKEMSLTKERVRQIKDKALVKLKCEALCSDEFETYRDLR